MTVDAGRYCSQIWNRVAALFVSLFFRALRERTATSSSLIAYFVARLDVLHPSFPPLGSYTNSFIILLLKMFRSATLVALLMASASAHDLSANSPVGRALLKSATVVEEARHLNNNNQYNYNQQGQNENGERDGSFVANYYIKYLGCSSTLSYSQEENGNDGNPLVTSNLVKFSLCPDSCSSCSNGGLYVVGMQEFVQAYTEMKMDEKEYKCEMQAQQCEYNQNCNYDDQYCEQLCFKEAGMEECIQYEGQEEFELDRYLECGRK